MDSDNSNFGRYGVSLIQGGMLSVKFVVVYCQSNLGRFTVSLIWEGILLV